MAMFLILTTTISIFNVIDVVVLVDVVLERARMITIVIIPYCAALILPSFSFNLIDRTHLYLFFMFCIIIILFAITSTIYAVVLVREQSFGYLPKARSVTLVFECDKLLG